jgi:hypothetical protein
VVTPKAVSSRAERVAPRPDGDPSGARAAPWPFGVPADPVPSASTRAGAARGGGATRGGATDATASIVALEVVAPTTRSESRRRAYLTPVRRSGRLRRRGRSAARAVGGEQPGTREPGTGEFGNSREGSDGETDTSADADDAADVARKLREAGFSFRPNAALDGSHVTDRG